jgi:hypothetical protein
MSKEKLVALGKTEWDEEHRTAAIGGMTFWAIGIIGTSIATVLNEIMALVKIADEHGEEEAVHNMMTSMTFVENICRLFMDEIDFKAVATALFEDGERIERERREEEAAAEAAKAKVKAYAAQKAGTLHRAVPSEN